MSDQRDSISYIYGEGVRAGYDGFEFATFDLLCTLSLTPSSLCLSLHLSLVSKRGERVKKKRKTQRESYREIYVWRDRQKERER